MTWDEHVASFGRELARSTEALLSAADGEEALAAVLEEVERRVAAELRAHRTADTPAPACGPGCASCCTVNVATLAVEGAAAAAFLRRTRGAAGVKDHAAALLEFHDRIRWSDDGERIRRRLACPFLDARGACAIHPVRPLACRSLTSLDAAECVGALAARADDDAPGLVRADALQKALYDEAICALVDALRARGLDARCRDVSGMTAVFLADPGRARAFLAGAPLPLD